MLKLALAIVTALVLVPASSLGAQDKNDDGAKSRNTQNSGRARDSGGSDDKKRSTQRTEDSVADPTVPPPKTPPPQPKPQ
jgi:hypothetical protein